VHLLDVLGYPRLVGRDLDEPGLDLGVLDPLLDVADEQLGDLVGVAIEQELRQMVVGVDPGAGDYLEARLLGDPSHELDVTTEEHRGRIADRLHAQRERRVGLPDRDVEVVSGRDGMRRILLGGAGARPLLVYGLVSRTQVLVDQSGPELLGLDRPPNGFHPVHRARKPMPTRSSASLCLKTGAWTLTVTGGTGILPPRQLGEARTSAASGGA
jgi:hypothetical protein